MKKGLKIAGIVLGIILAIVLVVGGIYFAKLKSTENKATEIVNEVFSAMKSGDFNKVKEYINLDENPTEETQDEEDLEMSKIMLSNLNYEIVSKEAKLNECTIKLKVSNKDFAVLFGNYMQKALTLAFSQAFGGISEEQMEDQLKSYFAEQYQSDSVEMVTNDVTLTVKKDNNNWKIDCNKDEIINAMLPGYKNIMETYSNMLQN